MVNWRRCFGVVAMLLPAVGVAGDSAGFAGSSEEIVRGLTTRPAAVSKSLDLSAWDAPTRREVTRLRDTGGGMVREKSFVPVERSEGFVNLKVEFDVNSAALRPSSRDVLGELADAVKAPALEGRKIGINGHTDTDGTDEYNLRLSFDRAHAVRDYLVVTYQMPNGRFVVAGYGEELPRVANDNARNKQLNRRVEIELVE